jgi:CHAT domain-containing protein
VGGFSRQAGAGGMAGRDWRSGLAARAGRLAVRRYLRWGELQQLDDAFGYFAQLPDRHAGRVELAAALFEACTTAGLIGHDEYFGRILELVDVIDAAPAAAQPPGWAEKADLTRRFGRFRSSIDPQRPQTYARTAAFEARESIATGTDDESWGLLAEMQRLSMLLEGGGSELGVSELRLMRDQIADIDRRAQALLPADAAAELTLVLGELSARAGFMEAELRGEPEAAGAAFARWTQAKDAALAAWPVPADAAEFLDALIASRDGAREDPVFTQALLEQAVAAGHISPTEAAGLRAEELSDRMREDDPDSLDRAVDAWEEGVRLTGADDHSDWMIFERAAHTRLLRALASGDGPRDLPRCIELYERATALAAPLPQFTWTRITDPLAAAYKLVGRPADAVSTALTGLRGNAWTALLQNDAADVEAMLRAASQDAVRAARTVLEVDLDAAAAALEAGRGLIMFAARELRDAGPRLAALGRPRLAREWERALRTGGISQTPADLRLRVVAALARVEVSRDGLLPVSAPEAGRRLLASPTTAEIRSALGAVGADALVYLVAGDEELTGFALVVPAHAPTALIGLPRLEVGDVEGFEDFINTLSRAARMADPAAGPGGLRIAVVEDDDPVAPRDLVDGMCDWAWQVVVGPLLGDLETALGAAGEGRPEFSRDRPPRLILVPMQELALIPWHAARTVAGDGRAVHALELAVFSYAASARMVLDAAGRGTAVLSGGGLVVGDPDTGAAVADLPSARAEAGAIRDAFYQGARYVGRPSAIGAGVDGEGTAEQVRAWLKDPGPGAVLHLACHGAVQTDVGRGDSSYLLLARGSRLTAEELVDALAGGAGDTENGIALAALAACSTAKSGRGYDEAFNLGTALLAAGVGSVISAQWPVPDAETSVLMFMLHYFVREHGMRPVDALRAAQLWFLGDREPPACMPQALRRRILGVESVDVPSKSLDVLAWAGFVHAGR